jgi:hypothetical protein
LKQVLAHNTGAPFVIAATDDVDAGVAALQRKSDDAAAAVLNARTTKTTTAATIALLTRWGFSDRFYHH